MGVLRTLVNPANRLVTCFQDGRKIEEYVEKFLEIFHEVNWADDVLKTVFWYGLDDHLHQQALAAVIPGTFTQYLDHVLWLSGSTFTVGEADDDIGAQPQTPASFVATSTGSVPVPSSSVPVRSSEPAPLHSSEPATGHPTELSSEPARRTETSSERELLHVRPAEPEHLHVMPAEPELLHVMPAVPVSSD
ncbi:hypothetical protein PO909_006531 [Leuciscus waleckii]